MSYPFCPPQVDDQPTPLENESSHFTVFHAHLHVIPRYAGEPHAGKGIRHWLKREANRRT